MASIGECPVCSNSHCTVSDEQGSYICPQCGKYSISRSALTVAQGLNRRLRWKISAWINEFGADLISERELDQAAKYKVPSLHHRADRMLRWVANKFPPGQQFSFDHAGLSKLKDNGQGIPVMEYLGLVSSGWNETWQSAEFMLAEVLCKEMALLDCHNKKRYQVSPKGLLYLEGHSPSVSAVGFCAMWFGAEVAPLWPEVIEPAIRAAGYEPLRIDAKQHNGKIDDEIMASIRGSRFVVSDFTGNRGGVYYEAGFAHGIGLPVIFMCRAGDELHFDIRQYNCIFWTSDKLDEARTRLSNRIVATLGQGPKAIPV